MKKIMNRINPKKNVHPNCDPPNYPRKAPNFKSTSFFDIIPSSEDYSSSSNSQTSQNISTQTNFKSSTSVNLKESRKIDIYKERCTQTSKTVISYEDEDDDTPRYSPDSLSPKPRFQKFEEGGDLDCLSLDDIDYVPFDRRNSLNQYLASCEPSSNEFLTGDTLTKVYLTKNKQKISASQEWINNMYHQDPNKQHFQSECILAPATKEIITKKNISRFRVKNVKDKPEGRSPRKSAVEKFKRSQSFMSPTISSESKDQSLVIESIQKLISPTRKGRSFISTAERKVGSDVGNNMPVKEVPYIDSSKANLGVKAVQNHIAEADMMLNLKQSCEVCLNG